MVQEIVSEPIRREVLWGEQVTCRACMRQENQKEAVRETTQKNNAGGRKVTKDQLKRLSIQFVNVSPPTDSLTLLPNPLIS